MKITVEFEFPDTFNPTTDDFIFGVMLSPILFNQVKYKVINRVEPGELNFDTIERSVCNFVGCTAEEMQRASRKGKGIIARQLCHHICYNLHIASLSRIGERYGNKDHATVLGSNRKVINWLRTDKIYKKEYETFINSFK